MEHCGVIISDMLYLMSLFLSQTEESFDGKTFARGGMRSKMKQFKKIPKLTERSFIRKHCKKRANMNDCVAIFGNIHRQKCKRYMMIYGDSASVSKRKRFQVWNYVFLLTYISDIVTLHTLYLYMNMYPS